MTDVQTLPYSAPNAVPIKDGVPLVRAGMLGMASTLRWAFH